jgi:hypothetical protein
VWIGGPVIGSSIVVAVAAGAATTTICDQGQCVVIGDAAYPNLVVGRVRRVEREDETRALFAAARARGRWAGLPADAARFADAVRVVVLDTADRTDAGERPLILRVVMTEPEFRDENLAPGTLVRYAPHGEDHEVPPRDHPELLPYWHVTGCVLPLCLATDAACQARFLAGTYERASGRATDWQTAQVRSVEAVIDPGSLLPRRPAAEPDPETESR